MTDSKEQLHGTITARAELDRAFARLIVEDVTSVMSKNLLHLMQHQDTQHQEQLAAIGEAVRGLGKLAETVSDLSDDVGDLKQRMQGSEADRADMRERLERFEVVDAELARLREEVASVKSIIAERPAQREAEYSRIAARAADEAIKRLEARGNGDA